MLKKEKDVLETYKGGMVEVDGHKMKVHQKGEGKHTLVFMAGYKTTSQILDFEALARRNVYNITLINEKSPLERGLFCN